MQKIRKILRAVSEKTALPTNQATNYYQQNYYQSYRTSLTPVQECTNNATKDYGMYVYKIPRNYCNRL